jgi:hypothetical protein
MYKNNKIPKNYDFIFSDGGKQKDMIQQKDRHSKVFKTLEDMKKAGYKDSSNYDLYATKWHNKSHKVGLVYH